MFKTPVLLILFNRPDITQRTFEAIRRVRPQHLFVAADGPRPGKPTDAERCQAARAVIDQVDWPCAVQTLFRTENRGCGYGPAEAITWFFQLVECGIILEDDCMPDESFFYFCEELLEKYKYDTNVSMICGTNLVINWKFTKDSYLFSNMGFSWGWATWNRAWQNFDYSASQWNKTETKEIIRNYLGNENYFNHFKGEFDSYFSETRPDVWDFQWLLARLNQQSCTIVPTVNLVSNIGFGADSTHTYDTNSSIAHLRIKHVDFPLAHPKKGINKLFDWYVFERYINLQKRPFWKKVVLKAIKIRIGTV